MKWIKIFSFNIIVFLILLGLCEITTRLLIDFEVNYYAAPQKVYDRKFNRHPYGIIPINSNGYFDNEWDNPKIKHRKAYLGDSVNYGVGAGYPYRITEYLDKLKENIEHINLSEGIGWTLNTNSLNKLLNTKNKFNIDSYVYLMNLNDIAPIANNNNNTKLKKIKKLIRPLDNIFRGNSYFYTYTRFQFKLFFSKHLGYEASGYKSIELAPEKYDNDLKLAAKKLAKFSNSINKFLKFCIIILPYEMQISKDAANYYKNIGVSFSKKFLDFETQKIIQNEFQKYSTHELNYIGRSFTEDKVGKFFVFDKGDKIDFNHPNRLGHKILAKEIFNKQICID